VLDANPRRRGRRKEEEERKKTRHYEKKVEHRNKSVQHESHKRARTCPAVGSTRTAWNQNGREEWIAIARGDFFEFPGGRVFGARIPSNKQTNLCE
jgi:hypothetical protein